MFQKRKIWLLIGQKTVLRCAELKKGRSALLVIGHYNKQNMIAVFVSCLSKILNLTVDKE